MVSRPRCISLANNANTSYASKDTFGATDSCVVLSGAEKVSKAANYTLSQRIISPS
jgi:hypothetical protein